MSQLEQFTSEPFYSEILQNFLLQREIELRELCKVALNHFKETTPKLESEEDQPSKTDKQERNECFKILDMVVDQGQRMQSIVQIAKLRSEYNLD